jgi:Tn3 transposase DDE domain
MDGMSGVTVAKVLLDQPEIVAPIREGEAAGVPEHVRMDRRQSSSPRRDRDQIIDGLTGECLAAFRDEEPGEPVRTGGQKALNRAEFITRDRLFDGQTVLETTNPESFSINTLILQKVLSQPHWSQKLGARDLSALTPLIWEHVTPYGRLELDMNARLSLD